MMIFHAMCFRSDTEWRTKEMSHGEATPSLTGWQTLAVAAMGLHPFIWQYISDWASSSFSTPLLACPYAIACYISILLLLSFFSSFFFLSMEWDWGRLGFECVWFQCKSMICRDKRYLKDVFDLISFFSGGALKNTRCQYIKMVNK